MKSALAKKKSLLFSPTDLLWVSLEMNCVISVLSGEEEPKMLKAGDRGSCPRSLSQVLHMVLEGFSVW